MKNPLRAAVLLILLCTLSCKKEKPVSPGSAPFSAPISSPADFLSSANYDKLIVQVVSVQGEEPSQASINNVTAFLQKHLNKPAGIEVVQSSIASPGKSILSLDDIKALEKANRSSNAADRVLTAYIFFADGDYDQNSGNQKVLGIAYGFSSVVIFEKTIRNISGGIGQPSSTSVETSVTEHEFGHVLGLVNNGTPMVAAHQDEPHGRHCTNKDCLMYWATETSDMIANLTGNNIPVLDASCMNDLKAAGGK